MGRLDRALDLAADHSGNFYFAILAIGAIAGILVAVVVAIATGTWWGLVALVVPALWLVMWLTD